MVANAIKQYSGFMAVPVGHATLPCGRGRTKGKKNDKPILPKREQ
jgi:hypothetical protein